MAGMLIALGWLTILGIVVGLCWAANRGDHSQAATEPALDFVTAHDVRLVIGEPAGSAGPAGPLG